jgi:serine phosphatase RsbU (regulator of sigma subunit)
MELTERLVVAAAIRSHPNETVSGDAWSVRWDSGRCRIAIVDGAGHGPPAVEAAQIAIATFEENPNASPGDLLLLCHRQLRGSRGAVMAVAVISPDGSTLELAGVGNIEARLLMEGREQHPISQRGMLGSNIPTIRPFKTTLVPGWLLVLHTDGIRTRWNLADDAAEAPTADALAAAILARHERSDDDACVVVIQPVAPDQE